ncbi:MAG: hypothetical protein JWR10_3338 [Rubritepida sp.]|nr:hypothetical protein [Rubritepida sp.]
MKRNSLIPMTLAAGLAVAPMLAFAQADGTPGNPPSTALGRAVDRATGNPTAPDGTPGNPPGTAVGRATDRATGAPVNRGGTGNNPPGSMVDRSAERATNPVQTAPASSPVTAISPGSAVAERPRLSQIIGGNVYNERNERIGEVDDVLLVAPASAGGAAGVQAPVAIIQVGGFLGMGGRLVAVPLGELRWNRESERMVMPGATKEALQSRTPFEYASLRTNR